MSILRQHFRVVGALVVREMQARFGRKPGGYIWAVLDPLAHVTVMTVIFTFIARTPPIGNSFALFFASGYMPYMFYLGMSSFIASSVKSNKNLFSYPAVAPFDAVVARYILQFNTLVFVTIVIMLLCTDESQHLHQLNLRFAVEAVVIGSLLGLGIGTANIALFAAYPLYEKIFSLVNRPLYFISGVMILPENLPKVVNEILLWNPLVHVVMRFRMGIYPQYRAPGLDMFYAIAFTFIAITVGMVLFSSSKWIREQRI